jgi:hypothetical protein
MERCACGGVVSKVSELMWMRMDTGIPTHYGFSFPWLHSNRSTQWLLCSSCSIVLCNIPLLASCLVITRSEKQFNALHSKRSNQSCFMLSHNRFSEIIKRLHFCRVLNITVAFPGKRSPAMQNSRGTPFPSSNLIS